jgi:hypothetical protein
MSAPVLQQQLLDGYPLYAAALRFRYTYGLMPNLYNTTSRLVIGQLCTYVANALDALMATLLTDPATIAPQIILIEDLARRLRDLAVICQRFAQLSQGRLNLFLTPAGHAALTANDLATYSVVTTLDTLTYG